MSAENVEIVRSMHPGPDVDFAPIVNDDGRAGEWRVALEGLFHPGVRGTMRLPGMAPVTYTGLDGLREAWQDWLRHWASYRDEIEEMIDDGERVVVVHRYSGRPRPGAPEITRRHATVWTLHERRVASVDFNVPHEDALASVRAEA